MIVEKGEKRERETENLFPEEIEGDRTPIKNEIKKKIGE